MYCDLSLISTARDYTITSFTLTMFHNGKLNTNFLLAASLPGKESSASQNPPPAFGATERSRCCLRTFWIVCHSDFDLLRKTFKRLDHFLNNQKSLNFQTSWISETNAGREYGIKRSIDLFYISDNNQIFTDSKVSLFSAVYQLLAVIHLVGNETHDFPMADHTVILDNYNSKKGYYFFLDTPFLWIIFL